MSTPGLAKASLGLLQAGREQAQVWFHYPEIEGDKINEGPPKQESHKAQLLQTLWRGSCFFLPAPPSHSASTREPDAVLGTEGEVMALAAD